MKILFVNNFRGFDSTFIEFGDVNFLVGENSTGKTSIIKLIGIISSPGFWNYLYFEEEYFSFADIVEEGSNLNFFEVGLLYRRNSIDCGLKFRFINKENRPQLKELFFVNNQINFQVSLEGYNLKLRSSCENVFIQSELSSTGRFKEWVNNNTLKDLPLTPYNNIAYIGVTSLLFQVQSLLNIKYNDTIHLQVPEIKENVIGLGPIRANALRTYDNHSLRFSSDGSHSPYTLKELFKMDKKYFSTIIKRFGRDSGLFEEIAIKDLKQELDVKSTNHPRAFEVQILINKKKVNFVNVGFGVPQIIPIIVEVLSRRTISWFTIQEPETHLHPKAQAAFGDFVFKAATKDGHSFIIETHSDYLVDRYRLRIKRASEENDKVLKNKILFFLRNDNENKVEEIEIKKNGKLQDDLPQEYRDFFLNENLELISL